MYLDFLFFTEATRLNYLLSLINIHLVQTTKSLPTLKDYYNLYFFSYYRMKNYNNLKKIFLFYQFNVYLFFAKKKVNRKKKRLVSCLFYKSKLNRFLHINLFIFYFFFDFNLFIYSKNNKLKFMLDNLNLQSVVVEN